MLYWHPLYDARIFTNNQGVEENNGKRSKPCHELDA